MQDMTIDSYLQAGGVLTSPANVPPRYRAELMKLMATFVDSSLAGAAGFADIINDGPGIRERAAAARIVLEKTGNAERVLRIMGEFGADTARYANQHPWTARLDRNADIGATRSDHDMRLAVFNYPLTGWTDAVVMNLLMGRAVSAQLADMVRLSYQPLAAAFRTIAPVELGHADLAATGLARIINEGGADNAQAAATYWWPRVAASFGTGRPDREAALRAMGLRHTAGAKLRQTWEQTAAAELSALGLAQPRTRP